MPRIARAVTPGHAHHITQRGNRRQQTFFTDDDYRAYTALMKEWCDRCGVEIWAYCLMPNHVHLIAVPKNEDSLRRALGEAHRRYTRLINFRENWRGHLWQERFSSFVMDYYYLIAATKYVELNPVRAGLVERPEQWPWSSAAAHLAGKDDALVMAEPMLKIVHEAWSDFLSLPPEESTCDMLRMHEHTGRPLGSDGFVSFVEKVLDRVLKPQKPGPKTKME
jgi:putative transposase